jgi:HEAT repeat protein
LQELRDAVTHADGNERRKAVQALGAHRDPAAVALLLQTYRSEALDSFGVRAACAAALGESGQPGAAEALSEILADPDYWVRKQAATALGRIPGGLATQALATAIQDRDPRVRASAAEALGGREGSGDLLLSAYGDPAPDVAAAALEALVVSNHAQAIRLLDQSLADPRWQVQFRAASLAARKGEPRGLTALADAVRANRHVGAALREAAAVGDPAVATLTELLDGADPRLANRVLETLEDMPGPAATNFFAALATRSAALPEHRERAATALFDRRETLTQPQIAQVAELLDCGDPNLTAVALQILLERGGPEYLAGVVPLVHHDNKVVRHFSLSNLRQHGGVEYEAVFVGALNDANGANVRLALEALAESGSSTALPAIRVFANDRKYRRYAQAAVEAIEARSR